MIQKNVEKDSPRSRRPQDMKPNTPPPNFIPNEKEAQEMVIGGPGGQQNMPPYGDPKGFMPHGGPYEMPGAGPSVKAVDSGSMYPCLYNYVYIWPNRGPGYWMYLTYVGRQSIAGWVWTRRGPRYQGVDTRRIRSFYCY